MINVSIEATGKCEHCPHMVLEMNTENIFADGKVIARHIEVRCENEDLCNHLEDYLKQAFKNEEKNETGII